MKLGLGFRLPNVRGYGSFDYMVELAVEGEEKDFQCIWVSDHLLYPESYAKMIGSRFFFEPLASLSAISSVTRKVMLGTSVLLPLRNPVLTASMAATADHASKGRLIMGFGVGWYKPEFDALGIPFHKRGRVEDEAIQLVLDLWTKPKVTFQGDFFSVEGITFDCKPYQQPHPKILIGGDAKYATQRVARFGDGWIPNAMSLERVREGISMVKEAYKARGKREDDLIFFIDLPTCVYKDEVPRREIEFLCSWMKRGEEELRNVGVVGRPKEAAERVKEYFKAGAHHVAFSLAPFGREKESIKIIADEVMPKVL